MLSQLKALRKGYAFFNLFNKMIYSFAEIEIMVLQIGFASE